MSGFTTEAKVGLFVLIGFLLLAYMSVKVGDFEFGKEKGYEVKALFDNVAGLKLNVPVQIAGIDVGKVNRIGLVGRRAQVVMSINPDVKLPSDSVAIIRTSGVLGDKFLEIIPGDEQLPALKNGEELVNTRTPTDVDEIIAKVGEISEDIKRVTNSLGNALGDEGGDVQRMITNFADMSENLAKLTRDNNEQLQKMIENLTLFSQDMAALSSTNKENINAILAGFAETSKRINITIASLQDITNKINRGQGTLGELVNDDTTVKKLNTTLASLQDISEKINNGQGTLGKLVNESSTADKLDNALDGVNSYLDKEKKFKVYVDYKGEWLTAHDDLKSTFNIRIQPSEDRYYLLGVVSDSYGKNKKTEKTITTNGVETSVIEETWEKEKLKFNAQIARRYYDLVVRGGLIESGGGVGFDFYMLNDDLKFTFEAFSGDVDRNWHLRAAATYEFWRVFYVTLGYDDFISDQGRESPFVGLGLTFNDDDLKYLIGGAPIPTD